METEITAAAMMKLLGVRKSTLAELVEKGVVIKGATRDRYAVLPSVPNYCKHLREEAAARGGQEAATARARLGQAQADLAEANAARLRGELVEVAGVETFWRSKLKAFRNRVLAVPGRVKDLSVRQSATLTQELRAALTELAG